ncbi:hypothetical protein [Nocardioides aquiterrae]
MLAHGVHAALVVAGLAGLGSLLAPTIALGRVTDLLTAPAGPARFAAPGSTLLLPVAVTGTAAAAGIHAAMIPAHLRERLVVGAFFVACALVQLAWAERALRRPTRRWLAAGAAGNLAVVGLWAVTRTAGLPFGLLPRPEAVGTWDATCAALELVAAAACVAAARRGPRRPAPWREWHAAAHAWLALALTLLAVLSVGGGH